MNRQLSRASIFTTALCALLGAGYQPASHAAARYVFDVYGASQGLNNVSVNALCRDRKGFLWVGTANGLYRYDGHRFLVFSKSDGLPSETITALYEGSDGTLWVGTNHGLAWLRGMRFVASRNKTLTAVTFTQGLASDSRGQLYIATVEGLARATMSSSANDLSLELIPQPPGVQAKRATSVWIEPQGAVWFGCGPSVCRMEGGHVQVWGQDSGVPDDGWQSIVKDPSGNLWARSRNVLIELAAGARNFKVIGLSDVAPLYFGYPSLTLDRTGALLVPSNSGLAILRDGVWSHVGHRKGLPSSIVTRVLPDSQGLLWVGTMAGLARWAGYRDWESHTEFEGMSSGGVLALMEDKAGGVWAGTGDGLSHGVPTNGSWSLSAVGDRDLTWVANLAQAPDGAIWLSTLEPRAVRFDPLTGKAQRLGSFKAHPYFMFIDSSGNVWVAMTGGLFRGSTRPPFQFEQVHPPGSNDRTVFTRAAEDAHGDLWFGAFSGIFRLSGGKWFHYGLESGLASNMVGKVAPAPGGGVVIGYWDEQTIDQVVADGQSLRTQHVDRSMGLTESKVYSTLFDLQGRLWALTDRGVCRRDGVPWTCFDQEDGLLWNDTNVLLAARDNSIWVGTDRGLTHFPSSAALAPPPGLAVTFSEIRIGDQLLDPAAPLVEPRPEPFMAKFTVLQLVHGSNVLYRYRCIGVDDRWRETTRPEVSFDYLRPGHYRLEVQARWPSSEWSGSAASLNLEVRARWFESRWFYALVTALVVCAAWAAWKLRTRQHAAARARLQHEVDQRTRELRVANDHLRSEISERERADQEKHRLEEELLQAKKLESIGRLAGGVAHDFNNLLTVINGYSGLVLSQLDESSPLHAQVREILGSGERAAELTRRLLAFSRKQVLQPKPVPPTEIVRTVEAILRRLLRENIELAVELAPDPAPVMVDRVQIEQALINLVVNARDAIHGAGKITIAARAVDISNDRPHPDVVPGRYCLLTVSDTGHGMDEATLQHVFEPFFTTKGVGKGTGLGLAMVHGIVKQSGGTILADSIPGKGTTFRIYLPCLTPVAAAEEAPASDVRHPKGRESILVVEDEEQVRRLAVSILRGAGYTVTDAPDGSSALSVLNNGAGAVDLLVTDVVMPFMTGVELARHIAGRWPATRVLFMSGYTATELVPRDIAETGARYLAKPFTSAQLLLKVRELLDG